MNPEPPKPIRVLFDEWHSESWSSSRDRAREMQPEDPIGSSYQRAADALAARDFRIERNVEGPLTHQRLEGIGLLVLAHPCDPRWERTTSGNSPALSPDETHTVLEWVKTGGGLFLITEYEHEKYGDNFNELLEPAGLRIENGKIFDRTVCVHGNPEWFLAKPVAGSPLAHRASSAAFYRAGWCVSQGNAQLPWRSSADAFPPRAGVVGAAQLGRGRIVILTDSVLFGDERFGEYDHAQLWLNLAYWLAAPRHALGALSAEAAPTHAPEPIVWSHLKALINDLRQLQSPDGSVVAEKLELAVKLVQTARAWIPSLLDHFAHQREYLAALDRDLARWIEDGCKRPDFSESLAAFKPHKNRKDGIETIAIFPMYTPNASSDTRFEALLFRTPWPDWLADLEATRFPNQKFVPGHLVDFTDGYASECAVLFPETISLSKRPSNLFATIFCNREAARLHRTVMSAIDVVKLTLPPDLEFWLGSRPMIEDTLALWDLIHDTSHSMGELPFDPFMIRQRAPFWMYGLEELRVDLRSYGEARRLAEEGFPFAHYVSYAILLDRIFRFPITGTRIRNYDALGGQLLFAFLHQRDVLIWSDNRLAIDWPRLDSEVAALRDDLRALYKLGSDCSKMTFWLAAHDLISRFVRPNVGSQWKADSRAITDESDLKHWIDIVHPDEFPLGTFHLNLQKQLLKAA
jgi:Family of unknown function (DUF6421)/Domain of unknown function (DUF4350)